MKRLILFWILAIVMSLLAAKYQRATGPTHPKQLSLQTTEQTMTFELVRSHGKLSACPVEINIPDTTVHAEISFRRYPTNEAWEKTVMIRKGNLLTAELPQQSPAGKVEYQIDFYKNNELLNKPFAYYSVVRFKGEVPMEYLIPHIFFIFFAMLLSNFTFILAVAKHKRMVLYGWLTLAFLSLGGVFFGPIVQYYAFGDLWTGIPFGWDLTDNKTLIAFVAWIIAMIMNRKQPKPIWIIAAAIVMILVFSIPHSMFGSELNYTTGTVTQG